jgi:hypothetical protein
MDVDYSSFYMKNNIIIIQGLFILQLIDMLELGKTEFISNPLSLAWAIIDHVSYSSLSYTMLYNSVEKWNSDCLLILRVLHILLLRYIIFI